MSSSNRPFQFQSSDSKYVSQFFPGASTSANEEHDEVDGGPPGIQQNRIDLLNDYDSGQQHQLGELRHTRDRLKLNLSSNDTPFVSVKQLEEDDGDQLDDKKKEPESSESIDFIQDQCILPNSLPTVPPGDIEQERSLGTASSKSAQCDSQEKVEPTGKCSVLIND